MEESKILSTFAATLFALLNPLGMLPVFIGYTAQMRPGVQRWVALFVSLTVMGLMLLFLIGGTAILDFFGVTLDSFRMAGGILLLLIGIQIVTGPRNATTTSLTIDGVSDIGEAESAYRQIVIPFALPLLVGPGVIANLMLYSSEAKRAASTSLSLGMMLVIAGVAALTFVILLSGRFLRRILGDIGLGIVTRILGLLVAAIGMQFMVTGTTNLIVYTIVPAIRAAGA